MQRSRLINMFGLFMTGSVLIIVLATKFGLPMPSAGAACSTAGTASSEAPCAAASANSRDLPRFMESP